jgi:hypothetical protein
VGGRCGRDGREGVGGYEGREGGMGLSKVTSEAPSYVIK